MLKKKIKKRASFVYTHNESALWRKASRNKWKGSLQTGNEKTLTFTEEEEEGAIGRPFCHHGDQVGTLGKGPEVTKRRRRGGWQRAKWRGAE